ncbi:hypothetical protein INR49_011819 [Caranx melampygus]|nr:hypothetical protein INR49_011819 [Caranx melampygus]
MKTQRKERRLFGNRSFCFEKMQEYEKALTDAELCLNMCPGWVKGLFRKGRALAGLKRYAEAAQAFREVLALEGSYMEAAQELMRVQMTHLMGFELNGMKIAVRYPDRIPHGMGISKSALRADDLQDENIKAEFVTLLSWLLPNRADSARGR